MINNLSDSEIRKLRQLLRTIPCNGVNSYVAGEGILINDTNCCHVKEIVNTGVPGPEGPQGPPGITTLGYRGSFYDTTLQTNLPAGSVKAMELNTTDLTTTNGFSITNNLSGRPTRITAAHTGVYNLQFSAQLNRESGGNTKQIDIWININGTPIPWSTTGLNVQANAKKLVAAWNWFLPLTAGQYVEIMWTQDDAIDILASPATALYPETPSLIVTISQVG